MRLIDADTLIKILDKDEYDRVRNEYQSGYNDGLLHAKVVADDLPTVDAVPVIRCKDCKYWLPHSQFGFDEDNGEYYDYCELLVPDDDYYAITRQADDFCSRAERKEK